MSGEVRMTRSRARRVRQEMSGSGDDLSMEDLSTGPQELSNGSLPSSLPTSPSTEEGLRLSSSSETVATPVEGRAGKLVLWRRPVTVLHHAALEALTQTYGWAHWCLTSRSTSLALVSLLLTCGGLLHLLPGRHTDVLQGVEQYTVWCLWWVGLGVLSSVGLGTGLHTFLLYLGPHIAAVTMAAYECGSTDFPAPPYPASIQCPEGVSDGEVGVWAIIAKVRVEAFCWGLGTAIGELPPYFMARAARLSGGELDEDTEEFLELQEKLKDPGRMTRFERAKHGVQLLVERVGFFGILACASIPNPLFDLAGITCGHFLVPFWTFFGATLIGKAVIKMHIQKIFVILAFNKDLFEAAVSLLVQVPVLGPRLEGPVRDLLTKQREKLHGGGAADQGGSVIGSIFEIFVLSMVAYFVVSIIHSLAASYQKRLDKAKRVD